MVVFSCTFDYLYDMARIIDENSFEGAPGGRSGTLNYGQRYGTPAGGNITQDTSRFKSSNSSTQNAGHYKDNIEETGSRMPERPDRKSSSGAPIHPAEMSDQGDFEKSSPSGDPKSPNTIPFNSGGPLPKSGNSVADFPGHGDSDGEDYYPNETPPEDSERENDYYPDGEPTGDASNPNQSEIPGKDDDVSPGGKYQNAVADKDVNPDNRKVDKDIDQIFQKKITPTPDELLSALQYEMNQMVKKDKYIAKSIVVKNLKDDPKYYSRLNMLNIDDDKMKVDEGVFDTPEKIYKDRQGGMDVYWMDTEDGKIHINSDNVGKYLHKGYKLIDLSKSAEDNARLNNFRENKTTFDKTKAVLDEMIFKSKKQKQQPIKQIKEIDNIFKDLWNKRHGFKNKN